MRSLLTVSLLLLPPVALAQGLGAAAEKEKERRKASAKGAPAKVITDEELAKNKGVLATDPSLQGATASGQSSPVRRDSSSLGDTEQDRARKREEWRSRRRDAEGRVLKAGQARAMAVRRLVEATEQARISPEGLVAAQAALKSALEEVAVAKQALFDLEDEARRAGVPPGWVRE